MASPTLVVLNPGSKVFFDGGIKLRALTAGVEPSCLGESLDDWSISCNKKSANV